ncbi:MAG: glycosyltransferase family 4 protein [Sphingomonadaceae bacterium]
MNRPETSRPSVPNPQSFRVLHVITSLDVGGAQKHLLSLVDGLRRRGHQADVAFFKNPSLSEQFQGTGCRLFDLSTRGTFSPLLLPRLASILTRGRYQIVHTHLLKADSYGTLAGVLARTPIRISSKHNDEAVLQRPAVAVTHGLISRCNHRVVVLSDYVGRYVAEKGRVDPARITRIYYGLPANSKATAEDGLRVRAELGIRPDTPLVTTVGRITEQKGLTHLLDAMALLRQRLPQARLLIVGDAQDGRDEYKRGLLRQWEALGLKDSVLFAGVRDDVPAVMQACDLFVMASLWEGFGLVFLEAMAAARPIVATSVSAIPEVIQDGVTGLLVPPRDPDALAKAMLALLADPDRARRMGQAGLLRLKEQFTEDKMVESVEQLYFQLWRRRCGAW